MQIISKHLLSAFAGLGFMFLLNGCVAYQVAGDVQRGRMELLYGDPNLALAYF